MSNKLPPEIVEQWPEVFKDVNIQAIPLEYVDGVDVYFHDGEKWNISIDQTQFEGKAGLMALEETLNEFFDEYDEDIQSIDFNLNAKKVKADVQARTRRFLKKRK